MKKAIAEAKRQLTKHLIITNESLSKVHFEVEGFKGSYNKGMKQAPEWFKNFEKKNDSRWNKQEKFNKTIIERLDNLVNKNGLKE